jgi:hypothetical protein
MFVDLRFESPKIFTYPTGNSRGRVPKAAPKPPGGMIVMEYNPELIILAGSKD